MKQSIMFLIVFMKCKRLTLINLSSLPKLAGLPMDNRLNMHTHRYPIRQNFCVNFLIEPMLKKSLIILLKPLINPGKSP